MAGGAAPGPSGVRSAPGARWDPAGSTRERAVVRARPLLNGLGMKTHVAATALLASLAAGAYELKRDSTGNLVRWEGRVELVIDQDAAKRVDEARVFAAAQAAVETVDAGAPALTISLRAGKTSGVGYDFEDPSRNQNEIVFPAEWSYDKGSLAVTVVTVDTRTHRILDADIAFNPKRKFRALPKQAQVGGHDDIQNTLTHELGHALGLAHNPSEPEAVMYPMAHPGEINKRTLSADDRTGLAFLYPEPPASEELPEPAQGCSQGAGGLVPLAVLSLLALLRRRTFAWLLLAAPAALAAPSRRADAPVREAEVVATAEVVSAHTLPPRRGERLLLTELTLRLRQCVKGACGAGWAIRVPGGKLGNLEQLVEGQPVPAEGEVVAVTVPQDPKLPAQLYRLQAIGDFTAFARGVFAAGLAVELPLPGSTATYAPRLTPRSEGQPSETTHRAPGPDLEKAPGEPRRSP